MLLRGLVAIASNRGVDDGDRLVVVGPHLRAAPKRALRLGQALKVRVDRQRVDRLMRDALELHDGVLALGQGRLHGLLVDEGATAILALQVLLQRALLGVPRIESLAAPVANAAAIDPIGDTPLLVDESGDVGHEAEVPGVEQQDDLPLLRPHLQRLPEKLEEPEGVFLSVGVGVHQPLRAALGVGGAVFVEVPVDVDAHVVGLLEDGDVLLGRHAVVGDRRPVQASVDVLDLEVLRSPTLFLLLVHHVAGRALVVALPAHEEGQHAQAETLLVPVLDGERGLLVGDLCGQRNVGTASQHQGLAADRGQVEGLAFGKLDMSFREVLQLDVRRLQLLVVRERRELLVEGLQQALPRVVGEVPPCQGVGVHAERPGHVVNWSRVLYLSVFARLPNEDHLHVEAEPRGQHVGDRPLNFGAVLERTEAVGDVRALVEEPVGDDPRGVLAANACDVLRGHRHVGRVRGSFPCTLRIEPSCTRRSDLC